MSGQSRHPGSTFESSLNEQGLREEVTAAAIKEVIARQLAAEMMQTSRAQIDGQLDPANTGATLERLTRAAKVVGRELRLELVERRREDRGCGNAAGRRLRRVLAGPRDQECGP